MTNIQVKSSQSYIKKGSPQKGASVLSKQSIKTKIFVVSTGLLRWIAAILEFRAPDGFLAAGQAFLVSLVGQRHFKATLSAASWFKL